MENSPDHNIKVGISTAAPQRAKRSTKPNTRSGSPRIDVGLVS